ncbi:4-alpha-glucanotransferase [Cryobacterium melibiosiphilum]|uniref:4-alpha-glucanotransferase n=1 Tax=Cryobacterium melibiosiphilum TaxID=995039 RepID=A0A3A5M8U4_9MICO|nr:4-alpha-glucanotransferase [Cryobacterium melibiosiphilum]RJT85654.1 4-alpha-glucanotransferase [Cryobacterium melibiosiphilum]
MNTVPLNDDVVDAPNLDPHDSADSVGPAGPAGPAGPSEELLALAHDHGVDTWFWGGDGAQISVSRSTLLAVLAALGVAAETADDVAAARREFALAPWRRLLPPVVVVQDSSIQNGTAAGVPVHARQGASVDVWLICEDGSRRDLLQVDEWWDTQTIDGVTVSRRIFEIPGDLGLGWHVLHAESEGAEGAEGRGGSGATDGDAASRREASAFLVVTPSHLDNPPALDGQRAWGLMAQLYSVRSTRSWGIGDFADLADLAAIGGAQYGAGFVLVNPLHAAAPAPPVEPSPYLPTSRRFFHPIYLRVEDVPEYAYLPADARTRIDDLAERMHAANADPDRLDRDATYSAKLEALALIHDVPRRAARQQQFAAFRARGGDALADFALWCALTEKFAPDAPEWDVQPSGPRSAFALGQKDELADRIEFHSWLQWLCDEQLESAQRSALKAGMPLGIVHDLPVGVQARGADAWTLHGVLAAGVTVGAPPDMFNNQGQNWSQPPWHPSRLAETGYAAYRDMLRSVLRHAGGIRVDHVLGLFRLWWIPAGASPTQGTYVHYDHEALIGILALEAQRAGAIVVGEDLGVFEPWVRDYLVERGIFGTSILWFERYNGVPLAPEHYRQQCLTSVNTHDLPPTTGYLAGDHITLRESLGILARPVTEERAIDAAEQQSVLALARERGLLPGAATDAAPSVQQTVEALYALTALTPSTLLGVALVDAVGERRTQNQPGTVDEYPNWRVPLAGPDGRPVLVDDLPTSERFAALVRAIGGIR